MKIFTLLLGRKQKNRNHWNTNIEKKPSDGVVLYMTNGILHR